MKKSILLILTLTFSLAFANAQISVMPYFQGDLSHFATFPSKENQENAYRFRKRTQPKLAYTSGILIRYNLNKKWKFRTGLSYQEMGHKIIQTTFFWPGVYEPIDKLEFTQSNLFINIPIGVEYNFTSHRKITPFISFGTSLSWNFSNHTFNRAYYENKLIVEEISDNRNTASYSPQKVNFTCNASIGLKRQLTQKLNLNMFLSSNILGLSGNKNDAYNAHHFNIGLGLGLAYTI